MVGPTQVGKTSAIVVPSILRWEGPMVVASVKRDVYDLTHGWRERLGPVALLAPGDHRAVTFDPLEGVDSFSSAINAARDLVLGTKGRTSAESEFWNALAVKVLGALFLGAVQRRESVFDVLRDVESRGPLDAPAALHDEEARSALRSLQQHEPRTADGVMTTMEAMLAPWSSRQPLAALEPLMEEGGTCYIVAPRHEQRRYEGVLKGALSAIVAAQHRRSDCATARGLLMVLDEASAVGALEDLDQLAATGVGLGITLLTVVQDFAQLEARFGERAATIVNNHATRVVLGGLLDPRAMTYLPEMSVEGKPAATRTLAKGRAIVISGHREKVMTRLEPYWRRPELRRRTGSVAH